MKFVFSLLVVAMVLSLVWWCYKEHTPPSCQKNSQCALNGTSYQLVGVRQGYGLQHDVTTDACKQFDRIW